MKKNFFLILSAGMLALLACNKVADVSVEETDEEFGFGIMTEEFSYVETKAQEATSIVSFKAESTQGAAGSETNAAPCWNNIVFASDGEATPTYKSTPAKYWPRPNPNYNFYAVAARSGSNGAADAATAPDMVFGAAGTTITLAAGDNNKDVTCAYSPTGIITYRQKNMLTFEHIYARISTVKITANPLYDMTNITVKLKNVKTGGVYNLRTGKNQHDGTGWSSKVPADGNNPVLYTCASIPRGNNNTGMNNDLYVVPGQYKLLATWTVTNDDYTQTFTEKESANYIDLVGGSVNNIIGDLTGNGVEITYSVALTPWGSNTEDNVSFPVTELGNFGGLNIAPAPLYYNGSTFEIKDTEWNHDSYQTYYGKTSGSYYFGYVELGQYFDSRGNSFSTSSGSIDNNGNKISCVGHNDWRLPTFSDWNIIIGTSRAGSSVNGNSGSRYAIIQLEGINHAGSNTPIGLLLFPDSKTITGKTLSGINNTTCTTGVTGSELNNYLDQGCVFIPASGCFLDGHSDYGGNTGFYWSTYQSGWAYTLKFNSSLVQADYTISMTQPHMPARLVRSVN